MALTEAERQELEQRRALKRQQAHAPQPQTSTIGDFGQGAAQGATLGFGDEIGAGVNAFADWAVNRFPDESLTDAYGRWKTQIGSDLATAQANSPIAYTAGQIAGGIAPGVAVGAPLGTTRAGLAATQGALGGIEAYGQDQNVLAGAGMGAGFGYVGSLIGRPKRVSNAISEIADRAEARARRRLITRAQEANSAMGRRLEAATETLPFASATKGIKENFADEISKAAARSIGSDADRLTPNVLQAAKRRISGMFDDAIKGKSIPISDEMIDRLVQTIDDYQKLPGASDKIVKLGEDLFNQLDQPMTAGRYQRLSSYFGKRIKSAATQGDYDQIEALGAIKDGLDDMVEAGLGEEALGKFQDARAMYKKFMALTRNRFVIDPLTGDVSGRRLFGELAKQNKAYNVAGDELGDLATLSNVKGVGDSGTASRLLVPLAGMGALAGYGDLSGTVAASIAVTRALDEIAQRTSSQTASGLLGAIQRGLE